MRLELVPAPMDTLNRLRMLLGNDPAGRAGHLNATRLGNIEHLVDALFQGVLGPLERSRIQIAGLERIAHRRNAPGDTPSSCHSRGMLKHTAMGRSFGQPAGNLSEME